MLWFADDANTAAASASAISAALSVTWMVTWLSGNEVGVAEDGSKTAFSVAGEQGTDGRVSTAERYEVKLPKVEK